MKKFNISKPAQAYINERTDENGIATRAMALTTIDWNTDTVRVCTGNFAPETRFFIKRGENVMDAIAKAINGEDEQDTTTTETNEEQEVELASTTYPDDAPKSVKNCHMFNWVLARSRTTCDDAAGARDRAATVAEYAADFEMGRPDIRENASLAPHTTPRAALLRLIDATAEVVSDGYDDTATLLATLTDVFAYVGAANAAPVPEVEEVRRLFACYPAIAQRTVDLYEDDTEDFERVEDIARFVVEMPTTVTND